MSNKTPLHFAARGGFFDAFKFLVECGADLEAKDTW